MSASGRHDRARRRAWASRTATSSAKTTSRIVAAQTYRSDASGGTLRGFLRTLRLSRTVEGDRLANQRLERGRADVFAFADVDRAARVALETGVEETRRIFQGRALEEGQLDEVLVRLARADDAGMRPDRRAHPLPFLDHVRVGFFDQRAHSGERLPAPVREFGDSFRDQRGCRLLLARAHARLFHALLPLRHLT